MAEATRSLRFRVIDRIVRETSAVAEDRAYERTLPVRSDRYPRSKSAWALAGVVLY